MSVSQEILHRFHSFNFTDKGIRTQMCKIKINEIFMFFWWSADLGVRDSIFQGLPMSMHPPPVRSKLGLRSQKRTAMDSERKKGRI